MKMIYNRMKWNSKGSAILSTVLLILSGIMALMICQFSFLPLVNGEELTRNGTLPEMNDTTELPDIIMIGDVLNFTVMYIDGDGDIGDVRIKLEYVNATRGIGDGGDGGYHAMEYAAGGNFSEGVEYWFETDFINPGTYKYTFNVTDMELNETVVENGTTFNVIIPVPDEGVIEGHVHGIEGNSTVPLENADVIIYYLDNQDNNTYYYNSTTNASGYYMETLPVIEEEYHIYVNTSGYADSDTSSFSITTIDNHTVINFTLDKFTPQLPEDTTGEIEGLVKDQNGAGINGVVIKLITYTKEAVNGSNATLKTYLNFTATANETGSYLIENIPPGYWELSADALNYEPMSKFVNITTSLSTLDITLNILPSVDIYTVRGFIDPPASSIVFSGHGKVAHNVSSGEFTITEVINGKYNLDVSHPGYDDKKVSINVNGSDLSINITLDLKTQDDNDTKTVPVGPVLDEDGKPVEGVVIEVVINNVTYNATTNENGIATLVIPLDKTLDNNTKVKGTKDENTIEWNYTDDIPAYTETNKESEEGSSAFVWIVIIILCVIIFIVIGVVLLTRKD